MRLLIINPPHPAIGSRIPREQLPPLGLLSIGGPLIDDGHDVALIDAEFGPMPFGDIVRAATAARPDVILLGHSGSTSAHPIVAELTRVLAHRDAKLRHAMRWYTRMGRRVWPHEIISFLFRERRVKHGPTLAEFFGTAQDAEEESMRATTKERNTSPPRAEVELV